MAIKKFQHKSLGPDEKVTVDGKSAIIETKEIEHCFPQYGVTVKAKSKEEAEAKLKDIIKN